MIPLTLDAMKNIQISINHKNNAKKISSRVKFCIKMEFKKYLKVICLISSYKISVKDFF